MSLFSLNVHVDLDQASIFQGSHSSQMIEMKHDRDESDATLSASDNDMDFKQHEVKRPRMTPSKQASVKVDYEVPSRESGGDEGPSPEYVAVFNELLDMNPEKDHLQLLKSINQLVPLHEALHHEITEDFDLSRHAIRDVKGFKDSLDQYPEIFERILGENKYTLMRDMCNFIYFSSLITNDIDHLPDVKMKEAFKGLYDEICQDGEHVWEVIREF